MTTTNNLQEAAQRTIVKNKNMKNWIKETAAKITEGYENPFTGDLMDDRTYVHFKMFAVPLEECEKFESFDELLKASLKNF